MTIHAQGELRSWTAALVAEMTLGARSDGPNPGRWPGLTFYRYTEPTHPIWDESTPLSICIVAHDAGEGWDENSRRGDHVVAFLVIGGDTCTGTLRFDASPDRPCLCLLLEVDPQLISAISTNMLDCVHLPADEGYAVTTLDDVLLSSVVRFLRSLSGASDRLVLTPLYLQELVYRILQRGQHARLVRLAARHLSAVPVAAALDYIAAHLADPLTVAELAAQANMSQSAFTRVFREATGRSPYQFVKEKRLDRARELLDAGRMSVTDVSRNVGYLGLSHFIKEFRNQYGTTPGEYADARTPRGAMRAHRTDGRSTASVSPAYPSDRLPVADPAPTPRRSREQVLAEAGSR